MSNLSRQPPTLLIFVVLILSRGGCGGDQHQQQKTGKTEVGGHQNQDLSSSSSSLSNNAFSVGSSSGIGDLDTCKGEKWCSSLGEAEALALDAIRSLHQQLDDDNNGNIDLSETKDFLTEELKYEKNVENRQKAFHRDDTQVSVQELWESWIKSEVHNWTVEQTVEWLITFVNLPQHESKFTAKHINGTLLPILAVNYNNFLQVQLGVKDAITRQRISVKAMDVVLFGPPRDTTNRAKDVILTTLLAAAVIACYLVYKRYQWAQEDLSKMSKHMAELSKAEETLLDLQRELEKAKTQEKEKEAVVQGSNILGDDPDEVAKLREENMVLRSELHRAEVELQDKCWVPPPALQHWLQYTYELELKTYNKKKVGAEKQLKQAKDACDKLKKKRSSLMGAFVTTHGRSIDDVDKAILEARTALTEITHELQERMHRWKQVEYLIGCSIMNNPGIQYLENLLKVYGKPQYAAGPGSVISNSQDDIDDDAASSIYCPSVHQLVGSSTYLMFPAAAAGHQNYSCYPTASAHMFSFQNVLRVDNSSTPLLNGSDVLLASISEEDSVSGPTSHMQLTMARSKSASSMLNLRERGGGMSRESSSKDSSNGEDEIIGGDPSDNNARRVTFRADHRSRMKAYINTRTNGSSLFDSMDNEEARRIVSRALSQTSLETSSTKPEDREKTETEVKSQHQPQLSTPHRNESDFDLDIVPSTTASIIIPASAAVDSSSSLQDQNDHIKNNISRTMVNPSAAKDDNNGHIYNNGNAGVPVAATLQYSSSNSNNISQAPPSKGKGHKLWSTFSKLVHHGKESSSEKRLDKQKQQVIDNRNSTLPKLSTASNLTTSTISMSSTATKRSGHRKFTGMFSSLRKYSDKTGDLNMSSTKAGGVLT